MKKLIITADDYGMSPAVDRAIEAGIEAGIITSTNVMTNMPCYRDMITLSERNETLQTVGSICISIGLHWNLTCGYPVSDPRRIPTLIDENGRFHSYSEFRRRYRKKQISDREIIRELRAQFHRFYVIGGIPDYWNTHENVHVDFRIYRLFTLVARELGITNMRNHARIYVPPKAGRGSYSLAWLLVEPAKSNLLELWQFLARCRGMKAPDGRICCLNDEDLHDIAYTLDHIRWGRKEVGEIAIHPALEKDSDSFGDMVENRMIEYRMATAPQTLETIRRAGLSLVNFHACR